MGQKSGPLKEPAEQVVKEIRRATRRQFSAEEKIRIVLSGLRGLYDVPGAGARSKEVRFAGDSPLERDGFRTRGPPSRLREPSARYRR